MRKFLTITAMIAGLSFAGAAQAEASGITIRIEDDSYKRKKHSSYYDYYRIAYPVFYKPYNKKYYKKPNKNKRYSYYKNQRHGYYDWR